MKTNVNYPVGPMMDNKQRNCDWISKLRANALRIVIAAIALVVLLYLMIKYSWMLWIYVIISLISTIGLCVYNWLLKSQDECVKPQPSQETELKSEISSLKRENLALTKQIEYLQQTLYEKNNEIELLNRQIRSIQNEYSLENKYKDILILLQNLDICIEDISKDNADFIKVTKKEISGVLSLYGYVFKEYREEDARYYDCEFYEIDSPQLVRRAIVNKNGELIVTGKIYIPNEYAR